MVVISRHLFWIVLGLGFGLGFGVSAPLFAQSAPAQPSPSKQAQDERELIKDTLQMCYQCHGEGAVSQIPTRPTLAGQKADYIRRQLKAFKLAALSTNETSEGGDAPRAASSLVKRTDPVMEHMVAGVPDHLIEPLAKTLSNLPCDGGKTTPPHAKTASLPSSAEACTVCHGVDGISTQSQVPNLAGQQRAYLRRQLLLIRETAWGAQPREGEAWRSHPIMEAQAARIPIADIDAIAQYYTGLDCRGANPDGVKSNGAQ